MKLTLENTDKVITLDGQDGGSVPARIWEGQTESGIPVICFMTRILVGEDQPSTVHAQFRAELNETRKASAAVEGIPLRLIL